MKSQMLFLQCVLKELGTWCCTSTDQDFKKVLARVENEGDSFLTITLPDYAKDFQKSLDRGWVGHDLFKSFSFKGGLPLFLGGFLDLIFDRTSGRLLDEPSIDAIYAVQQITMLFGKIERACSDTRFRRAMDNYVKCEQEIRLNDSSLSESYKDRFSRISSLLWGDLFSRIDKRIYDGETVPKHGPGSTAEKISSNKKYNQSEWPERLEEYFSALEFALPSFSHYERLSDIDFLEPGRERPVRVVGVPKTLKTPRIIAIEPVAMQYVQQGILEIIEEEIELDDSARRLLSWKYQEPNQEMARLGSITGELATLDLSEASDRVSNQLVRLMLKNHPHFAAGVDASRSRKADVGGHGVIRLSKFASMGSALCFPVESLVFITVLFVGIESWLNRRLTKKDVKSLLGKVRTYGDDIIVPVEMVPSAVDSLETFGFKVNKDKSFWTGKFRESCGKFYFEGHDITVVRVRRDMPTQRKHVEELTSLIAMRNLFYKRGLWDTVGFLDDLIDSWGRKFGFRFPKVHENSPLLSKVTFLPYEYERMHPHLHHPLVKGVVRYDRIPLDRLDDIGALLKSFLKRGELPFADRRHLERAGRPNSVDIKVRWATPY